METWGELLAMGKLAQGELPAELPVLPLLLLSAGTIPEARGKHHAALFYGSSVFIAWPETHSTPKKAKEAARAHNEELRTRLYEGIRS